MNIKILIRTGLGIMDPTLLAACASEEISRKDETKQPEVKILATFTGYQPKANPLIKTRTYATHTIGGPAQVFWDTTDKIWVKADDGTFKQSEAAQYSPATPIDKSRAVFDLTTGNYTKVNPEVRYTNTSNANRVIIASTQQQGLPNTFSHLGSSGDCGTAISQGSGGSFKFTLEHKASYLCFLPRCMDTGLGPNIELIKIVVKADKAIAGTYDFSDGTLVGKSPTGGSNTITLNLSSGNFPLNNTVSDITKNGSYMVIAPGIYNITITYTLQDVNGTTGDITKTLNSFTCPEGQIKDITANLTPPPAPAPKYYMWDAKYDYWYNHLNADGTPDGYRPQNSSDPRWYSSALGAATESCKDCPNVNELWWYAKKGDPHWENAKNRLMVRNNHLLVRNFGGLWFRKKSVLIAYLKANGYPSSFSESDLKENYKDTPTATPIDYRTILVNASVAPANGIPANIEDYFFLPAFGFYASSGMGNYGSHGYYWTSSSSVGGGSSYALVFDRLGVTMYNYGRHNGFLAQPFE